MYSLNFIFKLSDAVPNPGEKAKLSQFIHKSGSWFIQIEMNLEKDSETENYPILLRHTRDSYLMYH